ncbi:MAG: hypothetical protein CL569_17250 [Alphaproteobacteria bacterium]|nr:hypothetical protein [Alphaproteobacteria bacterium]|tara:strand:+ start:819 stop:2003 length:1185 start_codon:yes stop_codon:yes gene_type:complete
MTEPGAGSDLQGVRTWAVRDGNDLVVNGSKTFITNGQHVDVVLLVTKTDPGERAKGISLVLVEADRDGFRKGRNLEKLGMKAWDTSELFFDDVRVPTENLLGEAGQGSTYLMQELPQERLIVGVAATADATRKASRMVIEASRQHRSEVSESMLTVGVECGGSYTSSGLVSNPLIGRIADLIVDAGGRVVISETSEFLGVEEIFAERAVDDSVREIFMDRVLALENETITRGVDVRGNNPSPDNIRGGLTTIEEKAIGARAKAGSRPLVGVLDYGEVPSRSGMHFMATPAPAVGLMTGLAAGDCQIVLFSTGVGNTVGNMVATTVKVTGNTKTATALEDNIDFDCSDVLEKGTPMKDMADQFHGYVREVASGRMTTAEVLDERETAISRFERSF